MLKILQLTKILLDQTPGGKLGTLDGCQRVCGLLSYAILSVRSLPLARSLFRGTPFHRSRSLDRDLTSLLLLFSRRLLPLPQAGAPTQAHRFRRRFRDDSQRELDVRGCKAQASRRFGRPRPQDLPLQAHGGRQRGFHGQNPSEFLSHDSKFTSWFHHLRWCNEMTANTTVFCICYRSPPPSSTFVYFILINTSLLRLKILYTYRTQKKYMVSAYHLKIKNALFRLRNGNFSALLTFAGIKNARDWLNERQTDRMTEWLRTH